MGLGLDTAARLDRDQSGTDWLERARDRTDNLHEMLNSIPLAGDPLAAAIAPYYDDDWLAHPDDDDFWQALKVGGRYHELDIACFHSGGWYDIFLAGTLRNYVGMRTQAKTERSRNRQWLLVNPRDHFTFGSHWPMGNYDPGIRSQHGTIDFDGMQLAFFDHVLRDQDNGWDAGDRVRIFVMGPDEWRTEPDWPLARAFETTWYLHSAGNANTAAGDGILSADPPEDEPTDRFRFDPLNPVPTVGGPLCGHASALKWGRHDQCEVEARSDVLCYTSAVLTEPIEVTGQTTVTLFAASSAPDTDFTAKLVDVLPDGTANNIIDGIIRARYRHGFDRQVLLTEGEIAELSIDLTSTSAVFAAGHRIRIEISSSNFPRFDRNPNHGGDIATARLEDYRPADQTIYHDRERPSRITLQVVPAAGL
jgi:putative CocE/NonD family hydrolase